MCKSGIYAISTSNKGVTKMYIGCSKDIDRRWSCHFANIKACRHAYNVFNSAYAKDNNSIKFEILELCDTEEFEELENFYINEYFARVDNVEIINKNRNATYRGRTKDTRNMKAAQKGTNNPRNSKLDEETVREIKQMLADKVKQSVIAQKFDISISFVSAINCKKRWKHVKIDKIKEVSSAKDTSDATVIA